MHTLILNTEPLATDVQVTTNHLEVTLDDGRRLLIPLDWYPRLQHATPAERTNWTLLGNGHAIEWPDLDEHIGVEGLLVGNKSQENPTSLEAWLTKRLIQNDPLLKLAGIIDEADIPDLAEAHDKYLGAGLLENGE